MPDEKRLMYFHGDWNHTERASIVSVIQRCEAHIHVEIPSSCMGAPWICAKESANGATIYVVRRVNVGRTFEGQTLDGVCDQLTELVLPS